jgi:hypothetical protein
MNKTDLIAKIGHFLATQRIGVLASDGTRHLIPMMPDDPISAVLDQLKGPDVDAATIVLPHGEEGLDFWTIMRPKHRLACSCETPNIYGVSKYEGVLGEVSDLIISHDEQCKSTVPGTD